jgi:hypothetical protein
MSFKKRETNQNKIRHPGRKRKIIATISLSLSLLFGRGQVNSSQSPNSNFYKQTIERNINLFEDNDQQVILVRNNSSSPTVRPGLANGFSSHPRVNPPAGASGLKPVRANPVRGFSTPHGLITRPPITGAHQQPTRLEGAGNPAGAGGGASSDDQCPIPENQKFLSIILGQKRKRSPRLSNVSWKTNLKKIKSMVDLNIKSIKMAILFLGSRQKLDLRLSLHTINHSKNIIMKTYTI